MANHKSSQKRQRQAVKIRKIKIHHGTRLRTELKKARANITKGVLDTFSQSESAIRKMVTKGVISKKTVSRLVSRLAKATNKAKAAL